MLRLKLAVLASLTALLPGNATADSAAAVQALRESVDSRSESGWFSGVAAAAVDGVGVLSEARGIADQARDIPMALETPVNIGSTSKLFVSVAIAQLKLAGKLKYEDSVAIHLPEFSSRFSAQLTIAHLLSHTSGLSDFLQPQFLPQLAPATNNSDVYKFVVGLEPLEEPGGRMRYTNANFVVLGELIERLTNTSFEQHIEDAILKPAGMQSTRFIHGGDRDAGPIAINYMDVPAERAFAMMTDREAQQEFASRSEANQKMDGFVHEAPLFGDGMVANGSGGMYATAADLLRFTAALRNETLLPWEELLALCKPKSPARRSGRAYGLGCESRYAGTAKESIGHGGSSFGMQAYMVMYPESGLDVVILSNHDRQADPLIDSVGDAMSED